MPDSKITTGGMNMDERVGSNDMPEIEYTTYDRLLRAWENSMELVRDFEMSSKRIEDEGVKKVFKKFAEDEGMHAHKLRELILEQKRE
jgi:rubrerythrin